jgi:hypothetical protein
MKKLSIARIYVRYLSRYIYISEVASLRTSDDEIVSEGESYDIRKNELFLTWGIVRRLFFFLQNMC